MTRFGYRVFAAHGHEIGAQRAIEGRAVDLQSDEARAIIALMRPA